MKGNLVCIDGRLMRHDPQLDDPELITDRGACPDCSGRGCEPPIVQGVAREGAIPFNLVVAFNKRITDDELRNFHDYVREWRP